MTYVTSAAHKRTTIDMVFVTALLLRIDMISGTFSLAHFKLNPALCSDDRRFLSSNLFSSTNFWIIWIWAFVVVRDAIEDKIEGTSVSVSNLIWLKNKWPSIEKKMFYKRISIALTFRWCFCDFQLQSQAPNQDFHVALVLIWMLNACLANGYCR